MDRSFDYAQKILVAVEIGAEPSRLADVPATHAVFQRLSIPEIAKAAGARGADPAFHALVDRHMSYWEQRIPPGQRLFVHYAIGRAGDVAASFDRLAATGDRFAALGVYHVEPQSSGYPASFPAGPAPSHWRPGETRPMTGDSIFWFNFFPAQPYLFEKTFASWASFQALKLAAGVETNQLVSAEGEGRLRARGADEFVQVNLNRFTSLAGFFASAHDAGDASFSADADYAWYGMLLRKI
jgi:hypothetical protein